MKITRLLIAAAALLFLVLLKPVLHRLFHEGFWLGAAGFSGCIVIVAIFSFLNGRAITNVETTPKGEAFVGSLPPGPINLIPSRTKWCVVGLLGMLMAAASGFVTFISHSSLDPQAWIGMVFGIVGLAFFGGGTLISFVKLWPGANSLRLDEKGFEVVNFFRKKYYFWDQTSDFAVTSNSPISGFVIFRETMRRLGVSEKIRAAFAGGRNCKLPDTYGLSAQNLAQLMIARAYGRRS
jgi:hypothetical protein